MKLPNTFRISREECPCAVFALLLSGLLNALFVLRLHPLFQQTGFGPYKQVFEHEFHLAGYDPYIYYAVTDGECFYDPVRHPLLAWMLQPLYWTNSLLESLLGVNCVQFVMALLVMFSSVYSCVFLYRIMRQLVGSTRNDALLLTVWFFSMAYILLSVIVPDHFTFSMTMLLLTLLLTGKAIKQTSDLPSWQWIALFLITAGITLSNGLKVLLSCLFVRRRHFWHWHTLVGVAIVPTLFIGAAALWQQKNVAEPRAKAQQAEQQRKAEREEQRILTLAPEQQQKIREQQAKRQKVLERQAAKRGKPMQDKGFLLWTDISTSRWQSAYENMFGESIIFHKDHFLGDTLVHRPVFVSYSHPLFYAVEALFVLLFLAGLWAGRRHRLLWLTLAMSAIDATIHLVLGFGINEIHIMAPHWLFIMPIAVAFLLHAYPVNGTAISTTQRRLRRSLRATIATLTLFLVSYNGYLLVQFLLSPINSNL